LLPLAGEFFIPGDPCVPLGEQVVLAGNTHVVTQAFPQNPVKTVNVYLNMAGVQGTGQTSGGLYLGTGSNKVIGLPWPPEPFLTLPVSASFSLEPTNGCASVPLPLNFDLHFASDGTLLPDSSVSIGGTCSAVGGAAAC
jgi:hypothetical protein